MDFKNTLKPVHLFLTLLTVVVWGVNFIAIYIGLKDLPPFLFCTIRFALSAFPFVFLVPKPKTNFKLLVGFGLFNFVLQFGLLFSGIQLGLSPGLSSLIMQVQVFFSIGLAFLFFGEKPGFIKVLGSLISFVGIGVVAVHINGSATIVGLLLTLLASFSWAAGNMFTKKIQAESPLALVIWGNLIAFPFMAVTSYFIDGAPLIIHSLQNISWATVVAITYVVYVSTFLGYSIWGFLLKKYTTSAVVPYTLLIPVVGFFSSAVYLKEELTDWKLWASFFIMIGIVFNIFEAKIRFLLKTIK